MRKSSQRVLEVAMLAAIVCSGPVYAQTSAPDGGPGQGRQDVREDGRDLRQDRQDRQGDRRDLRQTTETCAPTVRICDTTSGVFVRTGNNCSMMDALGRAPDNSSRTGNRCGTTVTMSRATIGIYGAIARTGEATGLISEAIDRTGIRIGRT